MITNSVNDAIAMSRDGHPFVLYNGDCRHLLGKVPEDLASLTVTSPPYFVGKSYDTSIELKGFEELHRAILADVVRITKDGGSVCWQIGHHVSSGRCTPLDFVIHGIFSSSPELTLRNRIIWTFGHGVHASKRFSGRHETILWYTKGQDIHFDLDAVRIPQKYRGKKYYKGPKKGEWSSNPKGKNPGDVWEIPNVKANHIEKTAHPCQFPIALAQRLIKALSKEKELVVDPFCGAGTAGIAAAIEGRKFLGAETNTNYCMIALDRYESFTSNALKLRPIDRPIYEPDPRSEVARDPFLMTEEGS